MNFTGLITGGVVFLAIGLGFVWVIRLEYHLGASAWKVILPAGLAVVIASTFVPCFWGSAVIGILGGTMVWGATELPDQEKRARAGQFPVKPGKEGSHGD